MPSWNEVLSQLKDKDNEISKQNALDIIRRDYLLKLHEKTGRNLICYYSGFLQYPNDYSISINDDDKNGFMATTHGLDRSLGLDLMLHTPGGGVDATESIVHYLKVMFDSDIRVIIPQIAMSAGTMIACSSKSIVMGKQSNLGPIDPQFGGIPAHGVIEEFEKACLEIKKDPSLIPIYQTIIGKYHPTFLGDCEKAIHQSTEIVTNWLKETMFKNEANADSKVSEIVSYLNNHADTKSHGRHIHFDVAKEIGLKIEDLEEDDEMQDLVLTVHHAYMHSFSNSLSVKIIENHKGQAVIKNLNT